MRKVESWSEASRFAAGADHGRRTTMAALQVSLDQDDVKLLLQSLDHCLATCQHKAAAGKEAPCTDCDRARALRERLAKLA
jgi:hypothetical protein